MNQSQVNNRFTKVLGYSLVKVDKDGKVEYYENGLDAAYWTSALNIKRSLFKSVDQAVEFLNNGSDFNSLIRYDTYYKPPVLLPVGEYFIRIEKVQVGSGGSDDSVVMKYLVEEITHTKILNEYHSIEVGSVKITRDDIVLVDTAKGL